MAKIDEAKEGAVIQVVDPAVTPDKKSGPPRLLIILGGLFGGFILMALWIFLSETLAVSRTDPHARELLESLLPIRGKRANA
jgi:tyrosine-protein kinase Etk/Wzc